jgi:hypothetical protein
MEIRIKRTREAIKGLFSGQNWRLNSRIDVSLSEAEKALIGRYYDPSVSANTHIRFYYEGRDDSFKRVDVQEKSTQLSSFELTASVRGHEYIEALQQFEEAAVKALQHALRHLQILDYWGGETSLGFELEEPPDQPAQMPAPDNAQHDPEW